MYSTTANHMVKNRCIKQQLLLRVLVLMNSIVCMCVSIVVLHWCTYVPMYHMHTYTGAVTK